MSVEIKVIPTVQMPNSWSPHTELVPANWKVTHFYLWLHKPPNLLKVQLKATFNILYKMEFVTSSKGKLALMQLCSDVCGISSETIRGLASLENAVQSSVTLAAWRYPWRYWSASALRLLLTIDGTCKRWEPAGDPNNPTQTPYLQNHPSLEGQAVPRDSRRDSQGSQLLYAFRTG